MKELITFLFTGILIPLMVNECGDWFPWMASRVIHKASMRLPADHRDRYKEEWSAELQEFQGGKIGKLIFSLRIYWGSIEMGRVLSEDSPTSFEWRLRIIKGVFDRIIAITIMLTLAPLIATIIVIIQIQTGKSGIVAHRRIGRNGRVFREFSFRSWADYSKIIPKDGKIALTPTGRLVSYLMAKDSLSWLPQLINVMKGDMSLVGWSCNDLKSLSENPQHPCLFSAKPGIVSITKVARQTHKNLTPAEISLLETRYMENWSIILDFQIIRKIMES